MKSDDLLRHLGSVKDEYIEEIMTERGKAWRRAAEDNENSGDFCTLRC